MPIWTGVEKIVDGVEKYSPVKKVPFVAVRKEGHADIKGPITTDFLEKGTTVGQYSLYLLNNSRIWESV